jgi:hypothetical protein
MGMFPLLRLEGIVNRSKKVNIRITCAFIIYFGGRANRSKKVVGGGNFTTFIIRYISIY